MDLIWKFAFTIVCVVLLIAVRYTNKIFNPNGWLNAEFTDLEDLADENGKYLPGIKGLIYSWVLFALLAMWMDFSGLVVFGGGVFLFIAFHLYSAMRTT